MQLHSAKQMTEAELQTNILSLCKLLHLLAYHTYDSRRSNSGFPDLVIVGNNTIFRELKTQKGKLSVDQQIWLIGLEKSGSDVGVWRPMHWLDGSIQETLKGLAR